MATSWQVKAAVSAAYSQQQRHSTISQRLKPISMAASSCHHLASSFGSHSGKEGSHMLQSKTKWSFQEASAFQKTAEWASSSHPEPLKARQPAVMRLTAQREKYFGWPAFKEHQLGEWFGLFTTYDAQGEVVSTTKVKTEAVAGSDELDEFLDYRSVFLRDNGEVDRIEHDGRYTVETVPAKSVGNMFTWGGVSTGASICTTFVIQVGIRHEDMRMRIFLCYSCSDSRQLESIFVVREKLHDYPVKGKDHALFGPARVNVAGAWTGIRLEERCTERECIIQNAPFIWTGEQQPLPDDRHREFYLPGGLLILAPTAVATDTEDAVVVCWQPPGCPANQLYRFYGHFESPDSQKFGSFSEEGEQYADAIVVDNLIPTV